ncbi:MAG: hypothetical protein WCP20_11015 [Desulfuromonadales bacterium]
MTTADFLTTLNILVAFLGVLFVALTVYEFFSLRQLRNDFRQFREDLASEHYRHQQASHKVIASYGVADYEMKIALLKQAIQIDASVFNGYNSLGYAYIGHGDFLKAADAFKSAIQLHPYDKAGYCDLAYAYSKLGDNALRDEYLAKAVEIDPTAESDIANDARFNLHTK